MNNIDLVIDKIGLVFDKIGFLIAFFIGYGISKIHKDKKDKQINVEIKERY